MPILYYNYNAFIGPYNVGYIFLFLIKTLITSASVWIEWIH